MSCGTRILLGIATAFGVALLTAAIVAAYVCGGQATWHGH